MAKIKELPESERPRERLLAHGASALSTAELLAIILRQSGSRGTSVLSLAQDILKTYCSLDSLCRIQPDELCQFKGVGPAKAAELKAVFELAARLAKSTRSAVPLETPEDIMQLLGEEMRQLSGESLRVLAVNSKLKLITVQEVSHGTINETVAHPRDIVRVGIQHEAYGLILVHNHPSGDPAPSQADLDFTLRVREASRLMQIEFLDHVILGVATKDRPGYYSFKEAGYL
ncbi:MAG: DNA repair protein RadC [Verrucomicrobiota bacterium]